MVLRRVVVKLEAGKNLVSVVKVEVELVQRFSTAGVSVVIISMGWVLLVAVLEKVAAGKSLVLVVEVELVQRSLSAEVSLVLKSMDWVLLSLPKLDLSVGMALRAVVTVGTFSMSGSLSPDGFTSTFCINKSLVILCLWIWIRVPRPRNRLCLLNTSRFGVCVAWIRNPCRYELGFFLLQVEGTESDFLYVAFGLVGGTGTFFVGAEGGGAAVGEFDVVVHTPALVEAFGVDAHFVFLVGWEGGDHGGVC